jgi:6-phospho-beta-glucosidase
MKDLKIAIIGAGSTYTPELIEGFINRAGELPVSCFRMMDINEKKLEIVSGLAKRMLDKKGIKCGVILTRDTGEALDGADFVLVQVRVGGLNARILDEKIPLKYELIGQETTGIGGFMKALRTIPVMMNISREVKKRCPDAWLINFTNPSGIISEFLLNYAKIKAIGLCNVPINMKKWMVEKAVDGREDVILDYVGLNHLSWITGVFLDGKELLFKGSEDIPRMANIPGPGWDEELLDVVGAYPSDYLSYYYNRNNRYHHLKAEEKSRGEICKDIEKNLLELYQDPELKEKPGELEKRGGAMYSEVAVSLISAIYNDKNERHIANVVNRGILSFMENDDVVEISCMVGKNGAVPVPLVKEPDIHIKNMMRIVKAYEKLTVEASIAGDYRTALKALLTHPLVGDFRSAKGAFDEMLKANKEYLPQFFPEG